MCTSKPSVEKALRMQPKALTQQPETIASAIFAAHAKHIPSVAYLEHKCVRLTKPAVPKTETLQNLLWRRLPLSPDTASDANPSRSSENVVNLRCNPLACIGLSGIREAVTITLGVPAHEEILHIVNVDAQSRLCQTRIYQNMFTMCIASNIPK